MNVVVCVPYRSRGDDRLWDFTRHWIEQSYPYPIFVGDNGGAFSRSAARNAAAAQAGNWDVALFHDADTIAHPDAIKQAIAIAATSMQMVVTADAHMYCDQASTERILASGSPAFARPASFDEHGIYEKPCSGIVAVNRNLFDAVGGYVHLNGWGYEDLVFLQQCGVFGDGNTWVSGHINLHLWHQPSPRNQDTETNKAVWQQLTRHRIRGNADGARDYLATLGHTVP